MSAMAKRFATAHLDELPAVEQVFDGAWRPVRQRFGIDAFGVNAWVGKHPLDRLLEEHDELPNGTDGHQELYFVARGHARFLIDGEEVDAPAGTFVAIVDPAVVRTAFAQAPDTAILAVGAAPGKPFEVSNWERRHLGG